HLHRARRGLPLPRSMNPFRSVGGRLSIALALVVAAALALVDLIVVPSLERNLIDSKLSELHDSAPGIKHQVQDASGANLHLVLPRLLIAGLIALVASLVVGYGAASMFARRLRRLERAAERIADGDFTEPVADRGRDEVGELARAFERMRERLAGLE